MAERGRPRSTAGLEAALAARHFYILGRQKNEIADDLGISRFKVARLLEDARAAGMVHISVDMPSDIDVELGERVAARWGIRRCLPVATIGTEEDISAIVAQAAAHYLDDSLDEDDVVGLSWGRTLTETVSAMSTRNGADAVQLVGGIRAGTGSVGGAELVRRFAAITGGTAHALNAPFLVGSPEMAMTLRSESSLRDTIARYRDLSLAVVGIGSWQPPRTAILHELTVAEREALHAAGACADLCGVVVNADGTPIASGISSRVVGVTLEELGAIPQIVAVAAGAAKTTAVEAALRSGLISTLVVDSGIAQRLVAS